jgi:hypothetical protein
MKPSTNTALEAFRAADFDWATRLDEIWRDPPFDVPQLHGHVRTAFAKKLESMTTQPPGQGKSPLGWVVLGAGGSGKTHLLGAMRREAARQGAAFILVDMTDVRNFWETVLQGYLDSLQAEYRDGQFQYQILLRNFIQYLGPKQDINYILQQLARHKTTNLNNDVQRVLKALHRKYPPQTMQYQDVVRALICLNSGDFGIANAGMAWLQAQEIEEDLRSQLAFHKPQEEPRNVVEALSWFMSLCGPSVVAFDQLDPIVRLVELRDAQTDEPTTEQQTARAIINEIANGLAKMIDLTTNALNVVSCVEATWHHLGSHVMQTNIDRYPDTYKLSPLDQGDLFTALIRERLQIAYSAHSFAPPSATWPFSSEAVNGLTNETPREVLQLCEAHRKYCVAAGKVTELKKFDLQAPTQSAPDAADQFAQIEQQFAVFQKQAKPDELLDEKYEDEHLAPLFQTALQCLVHEHEAQLLPDVDALVEKDFSGGKSTKPLHARLRLVFPKENSREEHYCVRAIQRKQHAAFKTRLKAAMTQSGIDKSLKFRHLSIIRATSPPGGAETQKLIEQFRQQGGRFYEPAEHELRTLFALRKLQEQNNPHFQAWLQTTQPVTRLGLNDVLAPGSRLNGNPRPEDPFDSPATPRPDESPQPQPKSGKSEPLSEPQLSTSETTATQIQPTTQRPAISSEIDSGQKKPKPSTSAPVADADFPMGNRILGLDKLGDLVTLPLPLLTKHTIILGGSGSGKSVTVRRLVEEAALLGIPSIIVDCAQDMACFDECWPEPPPFWRDGDRERAGRFHKLVDQIVWTPGSLSSGNPLNLRPMPDFAPVKDDAEELHDAVMMVCDGLRGIVAQGSSQKSQNKEGVLVSSLRYFATHFPSEGLNGYIALLEDLPQEAELGIPGEKKLALEMAGSLKVERVKNPLLADGGTSLDPLVLFGDDTQREQVRVSVISLAKLKGNASHSFVNQLAMLLFSWIKQNPTPPNNRPLRGLLVIDEAKDFVPSQKSTECKESLMRLAAQARKYRLGLVFATQHPKDLETKIVGNCATHLYGLNNSPASLATLQDLMNQKGGDGNDIARLKTGQFYVHNADAGHQQPIKIKVPLSLSVSPKNPLEESQILAKAKASLKKLGR